tara:strand:+ start:203 stop:973 length:771 start_codon:yes stop_codon:yes gene_type:complete
VNIDIIIPSYHSETLTTLAIKSFEKYKGDFNFRYIVVENGNDNSYKDNILALNDNIEWIANDCQYSTLRNNDGSYANAEAIEIGLEYVKSEYVFLCHNDVVACHDNWMAHLYSKIEEGYSIAGTVLDNARIKAVHISGLLTKSNIAKNISPWPIESEQVSEVLLDVGDMYTKHCRENSLQYYCCKNTQNNNVSSIEDKVFLDFSVDRAVDDGGNVIFLHLGRGVEKQFNRYYKPDKIYFQDWVNFVEKEVLGAKND